MVPYASLFSYFPIILFVGFSGSGCNSIQSKGTSNKLGKKSITVLTVRIALISRFSKNIGRIRNFRGAYRIAADDGAVSAVAGYTRANGNRTFANWPDVVGQSAVLIETIPR